ncbi:hypothetical protein [Thermomonas sp.]|uniref:hypothetical protein n=1 Tax=Thermomonas sp. TaxID=1971895 RepID=UPI0035ADED12
MKRFLTVLLATFLALAMSQVLARSTPLQAPQTVTLARADGVALDTDATRAAILAGAASAQWTVEDDPRGRLLLRKGVRGKHAMVVEAVYTAGQVRFEYVDSTNLNYRMRASGTWSIHPNYMVWRAQLEDAVRLAAARN